MRGYLLTWFRIHSGKRFEDATRSCRTLKESDAGTLLITGSSFTSLAQSVNSCGSAASFDAEVIVQAVRGPPSADAFNLSNLVDPTSPSLGDRRGLFVSGAVVMAGR